jgi:hypothetical protein
MIWTLLIALAVLLAATVAWSVRGRAATFAHLTELDAHTRPVDLAAFRNLMDPAEKSFLQEHLPPAAFRKVQRIRVLAALDYLNRAAYNASLLLRVGEANRNSPQPEVASAARTLVTEALHLRMMAVPVRLLLYLEFAAPGHSVALSSVLDEYQRLTEGVQRLSCLQTPSRTSRLLAAL